MVRFYEIALLESDYSQGSISSQKIKDHFWQISPKKRRSYWFIPVDDLWLTSPRSRKTYLWHKKIYGPKSDRIRDYLFVASKLFPNQDFWQNEYKSLPPTPEPDENDLIDRFLYLKSENLNRSCLVSGFRIEYICLRLILANTSLHRKDVIDFYGQYANQTNGISWEQKVHRRAFLSLLGSL